MFWDDLRMFIIIIMLIFLAPIAAMSGMSVSHYLICDVAKSCND